MQNQVIDKDAVISALQKHPGDAFVKLKSDFMALAIQTTLAETGGNVKKAAKKLGITRNTIYVWMDKK